MEKGVEITFNPVGEDSHYIVEALANLVGNELKGEMDIDWKIFHVTLDRDQFYKVCYVGHKLTRLHPVAEKRVRERFDELAHDSKDDLVHTYRARLKDDGFTERKVENKVEEYDLWQDKFWQYF